MTRFENKVWLSSPTMHGDEIKYVTEAYETNWMSTVGENINEVEKQIAEMKANYNQANVNQPLGGNIIRKISGGIK